MELKKIAKRNERREKRVSNDKKRQKVGSTWYLLVVKSTFFMDENPNLFLAASK